MTVWVLHLDLKPQDEAGIARRAWLPLPFGDLPDLSLLQSARECRSLLAALHPDEPPETIDRRMDRLWKQYSELREEDLIAVPLPESREAAIAEVIGPYRYEVGESGSDRHLIPVKWHKKRVPLRKLAKFGALEKAGGPMREIEQAEARALIRDRLPHSYNRFAAIKWILIVFIAFRGIQYLINLMHNGEPPPLP